MRTARGLLLGFAIVVSCNFLSGQDKVAEGKYRYSGISTEWVLYSGPAGGYRLESRVVEAQGKGPVQIEELDERLIPKSASFDFFEGAKKEPSATITCKFLTGIVCRTSGGDSPPESNAQPYRYDGAFLFDMQYFGGVDPTWLFAGSINMARSEGRNTTIAEIVMFEGNDPTKLEYRINDKRSFKFVSEETLEFNGRSVAVKHYCIGSDLNVWVTDSGLLIKIAQGKDERFLLDYRQYKKLIPELSVEPAAY